MTVCIIKNKAHKPPQSLHVAPRLPAHWDGLKIRYRYRETVYHIDIAQTHPGDDGQGSVTIDGVEQDGEAVPLLDDRRKHTVDVRVPTV